MTPGAEHHVSEGLNTQLTAMMTAASLLLTWMLTWPDWLVMSTPAGASRDREEVVLSRLREWPAGERTALVARLSLSVNVRCLRGICDLVISLD